MQTLSKPVAGRFPAVEKFFKNPSSSKTPIIASAALLSLSVAIINHFARKRTLGSVAPSSTALRRRRQSTYATDHASPETLAAHKKLFPPVDTMRKVGVNGEFWRQISAIFKIIIPDLKSKEVFILLMHSMFLVLRTWLSVVVARLDGQIVRDLVAANGKAFLRGLGYWFAIAIPATYTNSMIRYLQSKLSIAFRSRLTRYVHDLYLDDKIAYYKLINLDGRITGADQYITTDLARFCDTLSSLYSNVGKPLLDTVIFNYQLTQSIGLVGMLGLFTNYIITARLLRAVTPSFGKLAAIEAKLEGDFRAAHTRLITNAEEIAFYNGADLELGILQRTYIRLIRHVNSILKIRIAYNMFEDFLIKYAWSAVGLGMCAVPVFFPAWGGVAGRAELGSTGEEIGSRIGSRTKGFITNKRLMLSLADAGGRIMYSYKEMAELAGHTSRVYNLISVLHALHAGEYYVPSPSEPVANNDDIYTLVDLQGVVSLGYDGIEFDHVPIVTPNPGSARGGELLVKDLRMRVGAGEHLLITGPNGVGKTAVARVIAGLWPVFRGKLSRPSPGDIFYIPQRAYLSIGSLRDQVIYPHSHNDMLTSGRTDAELMQILRAVHLEYIPSREGGWETRKEWKDVFSGGEKQRIGMARLFYHRPKYAVLDECTSAVSADVEGLMYSYAKDTGITLITISHRPALFKYHTHLLRLLGDHGQWEFHALGTPEQTMTVDKEITSLEEKLREAEALRQRLTEINGELDLNLGAHRRDVIELEEDDLMGKSHLETGVGRFEVEQIDLDIAPEEI